MTMNLMLLISILGLFGCNRNVQTTVPGGAAPVEDLYALSATDIHGKPFALAQLKGKKILIVNTASECGYTPQYKQLQELYGAYKDKGLVILGFPCDQFGGQEPRSEQQIESFCQKNYGVTFPLMSKVEVKGEGQHPIYRWLTSKALNGAMDASVKWNFHKFLVDEEGRLVMSMESSVSPLDERVLNWLEGK